MFYIYIFQNKLNHKIYVGKTGNFVARVNKHKRESKFPQTYFHKAVAKYGLKGFNYFTIEQWYDEKDCLEAEQFWIQYLNTRNSNLGYNLTNGGDGSSGYKHTPEAIAKMKIINKTKNLGRKHSPEAIAKMSVRQLTNHENNSKMNSGERNPNSKLTYIDAKYIMDQWFLLSKNRREQYGFKKNFWRDVVLSRVDYSYGRFLRLINGHEWKILQTYYSQLREIDSGSEDIASNIESQSHPHPSR